MKRYLIIIAFFLGLENVFAQESADIGKISLSIVMPDNVDGLRMSDLSKIQTKIAQIVSSSGLAGSGYNNNFVIYPKFAIYETSIVEGGMARLTVVTCEIGLFIKQVDSNILFSTVSKSLMGSGPNRAAAITNAISKTPTNDDELREFIQTGKNRIIAYYETICSDIIKRSESLVKMQDYEQAFGLLMSVPNEVNCYNRIQEKSVEAYNAFQNQTCIEQLQEARSQLASNNFYGALNILGKVDPSTSCFKEALILVNKAADEVDAEEKRRWDQKMKEYEDNVTLDKERINAVKGIAASYYKNRPTAVNYMNLIR